MVTTWAWGENTRQSPADGDGATALLMRSEVAASGVLHHWVLLSFSAERCSHCDCHQQLCFLTVAALVFLSEPSTTLVARAEETLPYETFSDPQNT